MSFSDLLGAGKTGRWWLVGSAWKGRSAAASDSKSSSSSSLGGKNNNSDNLNEKDILARARARALKRGERKRTTDEDENENEQKRGKKKSKKKEIISEEFQDLAGLAAKQRMNSGIRGQIFCVIMGSVDYMDAFEKLLKLNLRLKQQPEILRVLVHCCLQEKTYNPYYSLVFQKFCDHSREMRYSARIVIWDHLKRVETAEEVNWGTRHVINLALLSAYLVNKHSLSMYALKAVPWGSQSPHAVLFGITILQELTSQNSNKVKKLFTAHSNDQSKAEEFQVMWDTILVFFKRNFSPALKRMEDNPRNRKCKKGMKLAQRILNGDEIV